MNERLDNHVIRREDSNKFYVIEADKDGVRKYVKKIYSKNYNFTVVLKSARRFNSKKAADTYIKCISNIDSTIIKNPIIREVEYKMQVID